MGQTGLSRTFSYGDESALGEHEGKFILAALQKQGKNTGGNKGMCCQSKTILGLFFCQRKKLYSYLSTPLSSPGCSSVAAGQQGCLHPLCCRSDQDPLASHLGPDRCSDPHGSQNLHSVPQHPPHCYSPGAEKGEKARLRTGNLHLM